MRIAPLSGETTWSLIGRIAAVYGLEVKSLLSCWQWRNHRPRHEGGAQRADAEVLLDAAGRQVLARLCGVDEGLLGRALPSWGREDDRLATQEPGVPRAVWRVGGAVVGPVAFGCRLCAARRTGARVQVVRYAHRWERVCGRHGRWLLDADADQPLEHLDLGGVPEVVAAQRRWAGVARRAVRVGAGPGEVFAVAHAVVARWWEQALYWEREEIWPRRLHQVAGGDAGPDLERWRIVGRDAVVFPEVVAVADALLDPAMAQLAWTDSGGERPRLLPADGAFCRELGVRVGREWLGPLAATDYGGPLIAWMGSVIRLRRGEGGPPGYANNPWWLKQEHQSAPMASQLRVLAKERNSPGSGTTWRAAVPAERRALITSLVNDAEEQLTQLRGAQYGKTADAARQLLDNLGHAATLIDQALRETAAAALQAGVALEDLAQWARLPAGALAEALADHYNERSGGER
ncbi:DNA-binding protein [Streptantibioticus ferralitis]|uniref:DNA-binding protein n=1 Tax=Streptantibioticus ferralitis TaxID=236510 RepID=A0ABT5ZCX2_9ACTN|nr:DNA-binding protein [Streptantibioticus ferralitis]MDF2261543.1 DNA-binding protein [Streptantibioticus ferralitis]